MNSDSVLVVPQSQQTYWRGDKHANIRGTRLKSLLVIDDEESVRYSFRRVFASAGINVRTASSAAEGLESIRQHRPQVVVVDLQLPDRSGLDLFREFHALAPKCPVIFITAHGTTQTAIEAMKLGAFDYLIKPLDLERLNQLIERAFEAARLMAGPALLPIDEPTDQIIGRSPVMQEMCKAIGRIAPQEVNVLILGESGTGKELVARALYSHSSRSDAPFLAINCAAIPEPLLESELFGHEAGAFTGAVRRRIGKFEQIGRGTLFLDEIGDMPATLQAKLLRILQEQRFERIGGHETIETQVRILAATNQNLPDLIAQGRFRKDLYYRLNGVTIQVPPLRERVGDVAELANHFLFRFDRELNLELRGIAPEVLEIFEKFDWPGNVRELQGVLKQAMLNSSGHLIQPEFLPEHLLSGPKETPNRTDVSDSFDVRAHVEELLHSNADGLHDKVLSAVEKILLPMVLNHVGGNQLRASELLGVNRSTLRHRMRTLGISIDRNASQKDAPES
jgi:two-component system nitrogen regulation response regulator GlnG